MGAHVSQRLLAGILVLLALAGADPAVGGLAHFLPSSAELPGWRPEGPSQEAEGEALFRLINGGAEVYLRHGFVRAVVQSYIRSDRQFLQVEIYEMAAENGARRVLAERGAGRTTSVGAGEEGVRGDHYLVFRAGKYLVSIAGPDAQPEAQELVLGVARGIAGRLGRGP